MGEHMRHGWVVGSVVILAMLFRFTGVHQANDVFIDEITYADLAGQIAQGTVPSILGNPFFLHPPGSYILNSWVINMFGLEGHPMDLALQLRWVNAVLGAVTVGVCCLLVRRLVGVLPAAAAGIIMASDPFILRMDGRLMMETPAGLAVVSGWLLVIVLLNRKWRRPRLWLELGAGLVFGLAIVIKDMTVVFTLVPLLAGAFWRNTIPPLTALRMMGSASLPYVAYMGWVAANGLLPQWFDQKSVGVLRILGAVQMTGFNAVPSADLAGRLIEMTGRFGTSYLLLGLSILSGAVAATSKVATRRTIGLFSLFTGFMGIYSVFFGAAEEQFGYCVVLAALVSTPIAVEMLMRWRPRLRRAFVIATVAVVIVGLALGVQARTVTDDGLVRAREWMVNNIPASAIVGLTSVTGEFALLPRDHWEVLPSLLSLRDKDAQYVLTQGRQLSQGYGFAAPELLAWLAGNAEPVFTFTGPTNGETVVWKLDREKLEDAVEAGRTLPPVSGGYR